MPGDGSVRRYLELVSQMQEGKPSQARFVLEHGRAWLGDKASFNCRKMAAKQCFSNAAKVALRGNRWRYCEGYVTLSYGISIEHAWVIDASGHVMEHTLDRLHTGTVKDYFGAAFNNAYLQRATDENGYYGLMGWPAAKTASRLFIGQETGFAVEPGFLKETQDA